MREKLTNGGFPGGKPIRKLSSLPLRRLSFIIKFKPEFGIYIQDSGEEEIVTEAEFFKEKDSKEEQPLKKEEKQEPVASQNKSKELEVRRAETNPRNKQESRMGVKKKLAESVCQFEVLSQYVALRSHIHISGKWHKSKNISTALLLDVGTFQPLFNTSNRIESSPFFQWDPGEKSMADAEL